MPRGKNLLICARCVFTRDLLGDFFERRIRTVRGTLFARKSALTSHHDVCLLARSWVLHASDAAGAAEVAVVVVSASAPVVAFVAGGAAPFVGSAPDCNCVVALSGVLAPAFVAAVVSPDSACRTTCFAAADISDPTSRSRYSERPGAESREVPSDGMRLADDCCRPPRGSPEVCNSRRSALLLLPAR